MKNYMRNDSEPEMNRIPRVILMNHAKT